MLGAGLLLVATACGDRRPEKLPPPAPKPVAVMPAPTHVTSRQRVQWSNIRATEDCFFFSGPQGRDDLLTGDAVIERDGSHVKLTIDHAMFEGTYREGTLDLARLSAHTFDGTWLVSEAMHGVYVNRAMTIRYRYNECDTTAECPGRCTIAADLSLVSP